MPYWWRVLFLLGATAVGVGLAALPIGVVGIATGGVLILWSIRYRARHGYFDRDL